MATGKITISSLRDLRGWLWDTSVNGLGARRQTNGVFYYLRYRHNGSQIMKSIGRHGSPWTPDTARNEARRLLGTLAGGDDPFPESVGGESFADVVGHYLLRKQTAMKPRSFKEVARFLTKHFAPLHRLRLDEIDRRTVAQRLREIEQTRGPVARNRARSTLSAFFAWAITEGLTETNPVEGTAKVNESGSRERILSDDEIAKLFAALIPGRFADLVRLLLLTGQRRNEIGALQWSEVDLAREMIVLPPARTKNKRKHELPLSRQAMAIIARQPRRNSSGFLFSDAKGYRDWGSAKVRLDQRLRIADWVLHDLRRSCASGMQRLGVRSEVIERAMNHVSGSFRGVAGIYQRDPMTDEVREAMQRWADHLDQITRQ
jgi:integrase